MIHDAAEGHSEGVLVNVYVGVDVAGTHDSQLRDVDGDPLHHRVSASATGPTRTCTVLHCHDKWSRFL